jgi:EmrB/QacA subfamily drug resistance transporter
MSRTPTKPVIMAAIAFGVFVAADDLTVVSTMLRQIIGDLEIPLPSGFDDAAWLVNSYLIAYVAVMPFMGRLSDVVGRRKVYVGALVVFLVGSVWIPFTSSLGWFIVARVLTALGGGAMVPVALAVIGDMYEEERRPRAYGILGAVDTIGWVWGPLFGAMLVRFLDWRWQFYLNIPLALLGIIVAWWALQDHDRPTARASIDWPGAAALTTGLVSLNIALLDTSDIGIVSDLAELSGESSASTTWLYGVAAAAFVVFWFIERRSRYPIIDLTLFRSSNFSAGVGVNFLVGTVLIIAMVDVPLFVNLVVETSLLDAAVMSGWVLSGMTAAMAITSYLGGIATERTWYRPVIIAGLLITACGFLVVGNAWDASVGPGTMAWQLVVLGIGFGLVTAPTNAAVVDAAPADQHGTAAGLVIVFRLMGLAVGLSGLTAWTLFRFDRLRTGLELPSISDPGFEEALEAATAEITAQSLTETFLFAAAISAAAVLAAAFLRRRDRVTAGGPE